jgi:predicted nucleic acid-binding protein
MSWRPFAPHASGANVLVVDASVVITACLTAAGLEPIAGQDLVAPHLMWSEASSVLHELLWRREISGELATIALDRLTSASVSPRHPKGLVAEAWRIADGLGWAKTYDAEYLALARILKCRLLTTDSKLKSAGANIVQVIGPGDL